MPLQADSPCTDRTAVASNSASPSTDGDTAAMDAFFICRGSATRGSTVAPEPTSAARALQRLWFRSPGARASRCHQALLKQPRKPLTHAQMPPQGSSPARRVGVHRCVAGEEASLPASRLPRAPAGAGQPKPGMSRRMKTSALLHSIHCTQLLQLYVGIPREHSLSQPYSLQLAT